MDTLIREYAEEMPVEIEFHKDRLVIAAANEGGYNGTYVDLIDLLEHVKRDMPETWSSI